MISDASARGRPGFRPVSRIVDALCALAAPLVRARAARRAMRHLRGLDDHLLRDIGVSRWQAGDLTSLDSLDRFDRR